ncbi:MAG: PAS domain-containing sensor histidine kinase [Bacteroidales bacterium]|nr:PAS domain-containing sensor histidine kinase [Bacteroidales bacterium]
MDSNKLEYSLFDYISVGVCIINRDYRVQFWNEYMEAYTGYSSSEIINKPLNEFFPAFENEKYRDLVENVFIGWPPVILSSRLHSPFFTFKEQENKDRFQDLTIVPILVPNSESYNAIITVTDVTDITKKLEEQNTLYRQAQEEIRIRKQIQKKLRESEKNLKELVLTKDKFFSIIAHDLINPFNALLGLSNILISGCEEKDYEKVEECSNLINISTESVYALLINLLDWSRLQLGKFQLNPEQFKVEESIDNIISQLISSADGKEITIIKYVQPSLTIFADRNMFSTVIRNLLSNAIKFSFRKGKIEINASIVNKDMIVAISDTGIGMTQDDIKHLFKIDSNASSPGTEKERGTGLGLILCKEFIDQHKGKIWVESEIGKGSTFCFSLPIHEHL